MATIHETINSLNDATDLEEAKKTLLEQADALQKNNQRLFRRAKEAEGFVFDKEQGEWIKKESEPPKPNAEPPAKAEPNEPDYSKIAFLEGRGLKHADDQKLVLDEAKRLNLPLTDIMGMEHIQSRLKNASDQREAGSGVPPTGGQPSTPVKNTVEYWLDKKNDDGTFASPDDQELAEKVISARMKREENQSMFSDVLFNE